LDIDPSTRSLTRVIQRGPVLGVPNVSGTYETVDVSVLSPTCEYPTGAAYLQRDINFGSCNRKTALPVSPDVVVLIEPEGLDERYVSGWGLSRGCLREYVESVAGSLQLLRRECSGFLELPLSPVSLLEGE